MNYKSKRARFNRAKEDTEFKPIRMIAIALFIGAAFWLILPEQQFPSAITKIIIGVVVGAVIVPAIEFLWNYMKAPLKLADDRINELEKKIAQYKSTASEEEISLGEGNVYKGRWYGNKFVFDDDCIDFMVLLPFNDKANPQIFTLSCKPNSLGNFSYMIDENASISVRTPGKDNKKILQGSGVLELPVNENSQLEFESIEGKGSIQWTTSGWTES